MAYEKHVREVAEEMAANTFRKYRFMTGRQKTNVDNKMMPAARIAVRLQEEAVRSALIKHSDIKSKEETAYLVEQGLIPAPEQESVPFYCGGSEVTSNDKCTNQCGICAKIQTYDHGTHH